MKEEGVNSLSYFYALTLKDCGYERISSSNTFHKRVSHLNLTKTFSFAAIFDSHWEARFKKKLCHATKKKKIQYSFEGGEKIEGSTLCPFILKLHTVMQYKK